MTLCYRCKDCRKHFSVKIGTVMEASNLSYQKWALAIYLIATSLKGVSSMKLHRDLKIRQPSAWHLAQRIREGFGGDVQEMAGPVEVDETYIGGKERNRSVRLVDSVVSGKRGAAQATAPRHRADRSLDSSRARRSLAGETRPRAALGMIWSRPCSRLRLRPVLRAGRLPSAWRSR